MNRELPAHPAAVSHLYSDNAEGARKNDKDMKYSNKNCIRDDKSVDMSASGGSDLEKEKCVTRGAYQNFVSDTENVMSLYEEVQLRKEVDF